MPYRVKLTREAEKSLRNLQKRDFNKVQQKLLTLEINPFQGKRLDGKLKGYWTLRSWPYRIIYEIQHDKLLVHVLEIGHRKDIYK